MSALLVLVTTAPSPSPSPTQGPDELQVTPGLAGFVATFAVALACVLLFLSLTRHLRRAQHNAEERGLPIEEPKRVGFRRADEPGGTSGGTVAAPGDGSPGDGSPDDGSPDAGPEGEADGQGGR
ncbi:MULTISPECIES: hypothetical protein [unclassified Isoptericola]|uniref:hypothetical protein n=1 Tax=unclassified Isoptericola TaxID=2623355 RepID=UPI00364B976D